MQGKVSRTYVAAFVFALSAIFVGQSLADDAITPPADPVVAPTDPTPAPDPTPPTDPTPTPTDPTPTPDPTPSVTPSASPSDSPSPTPSPTPTKLPPHAIANQNMFVRAASAVRADPRANSVFITPIEVYAPSLILACISSGGAMLDVSVKNSVNNIEPHTLVGDYSNYIRISGSSDQVMSIINSFNGLRALSFSRGIAYQHLLFRFVAISEPTLDAKLCNDGNPSNNRIVSIIPFGVDLDMKKADVRLEKS
jgi:hypothetical protein